MVWFLKINVMNEWFMLFLILVRIVATVQRLPLIRMTPGISSSLSWIFNNADIWRVASETKRNSASNFINRFSFEKLSTSTSTRDQCSPPIKSRFTKVERSTSTFVRAMCMSRWSPSPCWLNADSSLVGVLDLFLCSYYFALLLRLLIFSLALHPRFPKQLNSNSY